MKKICSFLHKHQDLLINAVFIAGLLLIGIAAYAVFSCPRVACFGF